MLNIQAIRFCRDKQQSGCAAKKQKRAEAFTEKRRKSEEKTQRAKGLFKAAKRRIGLFFLVQKNDSFEKSAQPAFGKRRSDRNGKQKQQKRKDEKQSRKQKIQLSAMIGSS